MLQELGLSQDADDVYRAMIARPSLGVAGLCTQLGLAEVRVREALDELVQHDLLRESRETAGALRPVSPQVALDAMVRRQEQALILRQQELAEHRAAIALAVAEFAELQPNKPDPLCQRLVGLDAIQARLEILAAELADECLSAMPGGAQSQASLDASRPLDLNALSRGISVLTLYQDSMRNDPATFAYAQWLTDLGGQVRAAPVLPPRLLVFDRSVAVLPIDPANTRLGALCTREPGIVASLAAVFEQAWHTAVPLGATTGPDPVSGLTPLDRELLRLLGRGLTDEAVGNRLGISGRTVRRQMAALMERLGATSRFEAGLKAAQRGWL
jgi:DNA-binding CsgD family transcriptional regulator